VGYGSIEEAKWLVWGYQGAHHLPLAAEEIRFFACSKERQLVCMEEFIQRCFDSVKKVLSDNILEVEGQP
jgi:hypothetical protein